MHSCNKNEYQFCPQALNEPTQVREKRVPQVREKRVPILEFCHKYTGPTGHLLQHFSLKKPGLIAKELLMN